MLPLSPKLHLQYSNYPKTHIGRYTLQSNLNCKYNIPEFNMLCFSSRQSCICNIQTVQRLTFAWLWKCKSICNTLRTPHWQIHVAIQLRLQIQHPSLLNNAIHHLHGLLHIHRHPLDPSDDIIQQNHPANTSWCLTIMFHKRTLKLSHELISEMVA